MRKEYRLCGSGGQGIILAGVILAEAAGIYEGKYVAQVQDYGPAARGDSSKTDIVISDEEIHYPKCFKLDLLVALSQQAYDHNKDYLREDGLLIVDSDNVDSGRTARTHRIAMTEIARERAGSPVSVNMVALGAIAALDGVPGLDSIRKSMFRRVPGATLDRNTAALMAGYEIAGGNTKSRAHSKSKK